MSQNAKQGIKPSPQKTRAYQFAVRRLVRSGCITQSIILKTIECSKITANAVLRTIEEYEDYVVKRHGKLYLKEGIAISSHLEWMTIASDKQLLDAIENKSGIEFTGLTDDELPVSHTTWASGRPDSLAVITAVTKCLVQYNNSVSDHRTAISILYVGLRKAERAKWRTIVPLGIECVMGQTRIVAQDLEKEGHPIRNFVLSRIFDFQANTAPIDKSFKRQIFHSSKSLVPIKLNSELTVDQKKAARIELGISPDSNTLQVNLRVQQDFLRRYSDVSVKESTVWPIIVGIE